MWRREAAVSWNKEQWRKAVLVCPPPWELLVGRPTRRDWCPFRPPLRVGEKFNDAKRSSSVFVPTSYGLSFSEHLGSVGCRSFLYRTQYLPPMRRLWESGTIGDIKQVYLSQAAFISPRGNRTAHPVTQSNSGGVDAGLALPLESYPHFDVSKWKRSSDRGYFVQLD